MRIRYLILSILLGINAEIVKAQEKLDLNTALILAVKNNYSILLAKDSLSIAKNNNTYGNAGALPVISTNGGFTFSDNNIYQVFATSTTQKSGVISRNYTGNLGLNWVLFNGLKPFATKGRLNLLAHQGELNVKVQMESTISQVMRAYYNLIRAKQAIKVTEEAISIDDERIKIAQTKFKIGSGNKIDLLQAKVDRNQQESQYISQKNNIDSAKVLINQLLIRDLKTDFEPRDTDISIHYEPSWESLLDSANHKNFQLKSALNNIRISEFQVKERKADLYPILTGSAGYFYSLTESAAGFSLYNRAIGPQLGLNLSWNIFNGSIAKIKWENSKISLDRSQYLYKNLYNTLQANLYSQFLSFQNSMSALHLEEENVLVARENLSIALAKYRLGASSQLDLMTAEQSLVSSLNRLVQARFNAKQGEITLLQLSGNLLN